MLFLWDKNLRPTSVPTVSQPGQSQTYCNYSKVILIQKLNR